MPLNANSKCHGTLSFYHYLYFVSSQNVNELCTSRIQKIRFYLLKKLVRYKNSLYI